VRSLSSIFWPPRPRQSAGTQAASVVCWRLWTPR
jgi:hypothetical protein